MDRFEYCFHKSCSPKVKENFKPRSTYFGDEVAQLQADTVVVISDCLPSPQSDVGERAHTTIQLVHATTLTTLNLCADLLGRPWVFI